MNSIKLFTSNKTENLVNKLLENLKISSANNFLDTSYKHLFCKEEEIIITQNQGLNEWLLLEIAQNFGISMNITCWFPNTLIEKLFSHVFPDINLKAYQPDYLVWQILEIIWSHDQTFLNLKKYINEPGLESLKAYQIAQKIADLFDQYQIYRPEMILKWNQNKKDNIHTELWQFDLWHALKNKIKTPDYAELLSSFLTQTIRPLNNFPKKIHVFGLSFLPRYHLLLLDKLSEVIEIHFYLINPSPNEYWFDLKTEKEKLKLLTKYNQTEADLLCFETNNTLLASLGLAGKQFFDLIYSLNNLEETEPEEQEIDTCPQTLIQQIQTDILELKDAEHKKRPLVEITELDDTLEIHICHNLLREVEALKDFLLKTFTADQSLTFEDVLIMAPEINQYAPFIQMVFQDTPASKFSFNYHIADQTLLTESTLLKLFFELLALPKTKLTQTTVLNLLKNKIIQEKFNFTDDNLIYLKNWFDEANIKWGQNKEDRQRLGFLPFDENSWEKGLAKLLASYALTNKTDEFYITNNLLTVPCSDIEGQLGIILGKFIDFYDELTLIIKKLNQKDTLNYWQTTLIEILDLLEIKDDYLNDLIILKKTINQLAIGSDSIKNITGFKEKVDLEVIQNYLKNSLEQKQYPSHFFKGGLTFSQLLPMRSIPKKVVCLLGMEQNAFPRKDQHASFSLIMDNFQLGDKSIKNIDRYLFLEILLSVRQKLFISFSGINSNSQSEILPSSVISELIEYVKQNFYFYKNKIDKQNQLNSIIEHIIFKEKLFSFDPAYFSKKNQLYSYSQDNFSLSKIIEDISLKLNINKNNFNTLALHSPDFFNLKLNDLVSFFRKPTKFLLEKSFEIYLNKKPIKPEENELFHLNNIEKIKLFNRIIPLQIKGIKNDQIYQLFKIFDLLPPEKLGENEYNKFIKEISCFIQAILELAQNKEAENLQINLNIENFNLVGQIDNLYSFGL
ncbi:MAG: exodeoxyribonuclease V subunit gamma, partial [Candidatus Margulisiibacteriota bacterium]